MCTYPRPKRASHLVVYSLTVHDVMHDPIGQIETRKILFDAVDDDICNIIKSLVECNPIYGIKAGKKVQNGRSAVNRRFYDPKDQTA